MTNVVWCSDVNKVVSAKAKVTRPQSPKPISHIFTLRSILLSQRL